MFGQKCNSCGKKFNKKYEFCPFCGANLKSDDENYGFFGKDDFKDLNNDLKLPFGLNMMLKPLMKELSKQMAELEKEVKKENKNFDERAIRRTMPVSGFTIRIDSSSGKPIKLSTFGNNASAGNMPNLSYIQKQPERKIKLPKINSEKLAKSKKLLKQEPETNVRRLGDKIIYEIFLPGVKSIKNVDISIFENSLEVKAVAEESLYVKTLNVKLPIISYNLEDETLFLELALK